MGGEATEPTEIRRQQRAWILYDWAESAFVTTIVAAVFPVYYARVAGATLPSAASATQAFTLTTSIAVVLTALLSPVLGAYSDLAAAKKRLLALFMGISATATAALVLIGEGDWLLASVLFVLGRLGFGIANVFYDALLPAVASGPEQDRVSAQGYAFGYLGGGILLAINVAMITLLPDDNLGVRLSFLTVAVWWVLFAIPLLRRVPEPPAVQGAGSAGLRTSIAASKQMFRDLVTFPDLRRFTFGYLLYNDGINVVIGVAAIYGAELGFGTTELLLAILLVQFTGVPYSLLFGGLPSSTGRRKRWGIAFLALNIIAVPLLGIGGRLLLPADVAGLADAPYVSDDPVFAGQGGVDASSDAVTTTSNATTIRWVGRHLELTYEGVPGGGALPLRLDGEALLDDDGRPLGLDVSSPVVRSGLTFEVQAPTAGRHELEIFAAPELLTIEGIEVLPPPRDSSLATILALLLALQFILAIMAALVGRLLPERLVTSFDARAGVMLALCAYFVIAVWGFALDTVIEFWCLAWLVSVVQGGSQALSRSIYSGLVPPTRTGEFFGLFSILSKVASFVSPLIFVGAIAIFDSSRPAVLALSLLFVFGIAMLRGVDTARGRALALQHDHLEGPS